MSGPLILAAEAEVTLEAEHLHAVVGRIVAALNRTGDEPSYQSARAAMRSVPATCRWLVELIVEAEVHANGRPLPMPCGLRW